MNGQNKYKNSTARINYLSVKDTNILQTGSKSIKLCNNGEALNKFTKEKQNNWTVKFPDFKIRFLVMRRISMKRLDRSNHNGIEKSPTQELI